MKITRQGVAIALGAVVALTTTACAPSYIEGAPAVATTGTSSASASATPTPTPTPTVAPTLSEKEAVAAEAKEMVRQMVVNFKGVTTIPEECLDATFSVDLTTSEFYRNRGGKESAGAFGPSIGKTPCAVSKNRVERYLRDSSLLVTKANEIAAVDKKSGIKAIKSTDVARKVVELHNGPYQDRLELARKVVGWYTSPSRELSIVKKDGVYTSNTMKDDGTTTTSYGNKPSDVVETRDRKTGDVVKGDRINCGDQDYKPGIPKGYKPPKPGEEITKLTPKNVGHHPSNTGDAPSDGWNPASEEDDDSYTPPGGGEPQPDYTAPAAPKPKPSPREDPPPSAAPKPTATPTVPITPPPADDCDPQDPLCDG